MNRLGLVGLTLLALAATSSVKAGSCEAEVEVGRMWTEKSGFRQKANLKISIERAKPNAYVKVYVRGRFHIERSDGFSTWSTIADSTSFDTSEQSRTQMVVENNSSVCSDRKPCELNDVEITEVTCSD